MYTDILHWNRLKPCLLIAALIFALCISDSAISYAQSPAELNNRIQRLENEIQTLSKAIFRGDEMPERNDRTASAGSGAGSDLAQIELRLSQLEVELRSLTGQIEQNNFRMRQLEGRLEKRLADIEMRLADTEAKVNVGNTHSRVDQESPIQDAFDNIPNASPIVETSVTVPDRVGVAQDSLDDPVRDESDSSQVVIQDIAEGQILPANASANEYYDAGFEALRKKDYVTATKHFERIVEEFPGHSLAGNAQYWLGETYYVRNDYERAARIFAEAYQKYADGSKGPDNLLKLGMSLSGLGKTKEACVAFAQLEKQFPKAPSSILTRAKQEQSTLSCK